MADVRHAFFTSTLQQIYGDIRKACTKPQSPKPVEPVSASAAVEKETLSSFSKLKIERSKGMEPLTEDRSYLDVEQSSDDGKSLDVEQSIDDTGGAEPVDSKQAKGPPRLADDGLAEAFELCKEIQVRSCLFVSPFIQHFEHFADSINRTCATI